MKESVLYLEVDEDITSAIDKLHKTAGPAVQIVVPKRSTMLQSIINLKLLKKAAEEDGKELVLVTNDRIATNLAAGVGLAVATALGGKAVLAEPTKAAPSIAEDEIDATDDEMPDDIAKELAAGAAIATGAAAVKASKGKDKSTSGFTRKEITDEPVEPEADAKSDPESDKKSTDDPSEAREQPKGAIAKVPSYNKLYRRLGWVGIAAALVIGYFVFMALFETAKVTLFVIGQKVTVDATFTADPTVTDTNQATGVLAAQTITFTKDISTAVTATGKKDVGTKATGTMTVYNGLGVDQTLVAGTRFAAPDGKLFRSDTDITVPRATLDGGGNIVRGSKSVGVTADQNGDAYNEGPAAYTIPALTNPKITAQGGQMSGGTTKNLTVISQGDIDTAQAAALAKDKDASLRSLDGLVPPGSMAIPGSVQTRVTSAVSTPGVDSEATTATLAIKVVYTELAMKKSDFDTFMTAQAQKQVGAANQVYNNGAATATITAASAATATGSQSFHATTTASAGPKIDTDAIAKSIKGKRYGDAMDILTKTPGVQRADISLWPSWATNLPGNAKKITISIQVAGNK